MKFFAITAAIIFVFSWAVVSLSEMQCAAKWQDSGFAFRQKFDGGGCQIDPTNTGKFIPDYNFKFSR